MSEPTSRYLDDIYSNIQNDNLKKYPLNPTVVDMHTKPMYKEIDSLMKTMEIIKGVTYNGYRVITDERKFDPYKMDKKLQKSKKQVDPIIPIDTSRYELMQFDFTLNCLSKKGEMETKEVTSELLLLKMVDGFYYMKNGNRFYPIFQIVETSTYTRPNSIVFKTGYNGLMVTRKIENVEDIDGNVYTGQQFKLIFCKKSIPLPLLFLAKLDPDQMISFFMGKDNIMRLVDATKPVGEPRDGFIYLKLSNKIFMEVNKHALDNFHFVLELVLIMKSVINTRTSYSDLYDKRIMTTKLGAKYEMKLINQYNKGLNVSLSFLKSLDDVVKEITRLDEVNKKSTYHIIRVLCRNFDYFKSKNNLDLKTKRVRLNEHLVYHLNERISNHCNRLLNRNDVTMKNLVELVTFRRTELVSSIQKARLTRTDNLVNDMSVLALLKYSVKGPNSMSNLADIYRGTDVSEIGNIDIHDTSSTEPGLSGSLVPCSNIDSSGYFSEEDEPQHYFKDMRNTIGMDFLKREDRTPVRIFLKRED